MTAHPAPRLVPLAFEHLSPAEQLRRAQEFEPACALAGPSATSLPGPFPAENAEVPAIVKRPLSDSLHYFGD